MTPSWKKLEKDETIMEFWKYAQQMSKFVEKERWETARRVETRSTPVIPSPYQIENFLEEFPELDKRLETQFEYITDESIRKAITTSEGKRQAKQHRLEEQMKETQEAMQQLRRTQEAMYRLLTQQRDPQSGSRPEPEPKPELGDMDHEMLSQRGASQGVRRGGAEATGSLEGGSTRELNVREFPAREFPFLGGPVRRADAGNPPHEFQSGLSGQISGARPLMEGAEQRRQSRRHQVRLYRCILNYKHL